MVTSIVLTGCHNIEVNSANKIKLGDQIVSIDKDIPFVRYRFENYGDTELEYIGEQIQRFTKSTHLVEINLSDVTADIYNAITSRYNLAKYLYIDIFDEDVVNKSLATTRLGQLQRIVGLKFDRYMFKDKTNTLDYVALRKLIKQLAQLLGIAEQDIGVCSSPLSYNDLQCLTAVKARELMSIYNETTDVALPSANHQCMSCCGCTRYMVVDTDLIAPPETVKKKASEKSGDTPKKKSSSNKFVVQPGMYSL